MPTGDGKDSPDQSPYGLYQTSIGRRSGVRIPKTQVSGTWTDAPRGDIGVHTSHHRRADAVYSAASKGVSGTPAGAPWAIRETRVTSAGKRQKSRAEVFRVFLSYRGARVNIVILFQLVCDANGPCSSALQSIRWNHSTPSEMGRQEHFSGALIIGGFMFFLNDLR